MIFLPKKSLIATKQDFSAAGGNTTVDGSYNIHTFTSSGSLVIDGSRDMDILIVAGGGGGGGGRAGGGGGAGELYIKLISYLALAHITLLLVTVEDKTLLVEALA